MYEQPNVLRRQGTARHPKAPGGNSWRSDPVAPTDGAHDPDDDGEQREHDTDPEQPLHSVQETAREQQDDRDDGDNDQQYVHALTVPEQLVRQNPLDSRKEAVSDEFHKPAKLPGRVFEGFHGGQDPAVALRVAHETAHALIARVRADPDPAVVDRLVGYTDEHGIDAIAELWSRALPKTLPGALWRIYLVRVLIRQNPEETSYLFQRGADATPTIYPIVAGAQQPTGPAEIVELADQILRGAFQGDFADALDRAAAFCRVEAAGCTGVADDVETTRPERATELTTRASRFVQTGDELGACARLWRADSLD